MKKLVAIFLAVIVFINLSTEIEAEAVPIGTIIDAGFFVWSATECITDPSIMNCGNALIDGVFLAIPIIPNYTKGLKVTNKASASTKRLIQEANSAKNISELKKAGIYVAGSVDEIKRGKSVFGKYDVLKAFSKNKAGVVEAHHIIPQSLASSLGVNADDMLSILLTKELHRGTTSGITKAGNALVKSLKVNGKIMLVGNEMKLLRGITTMYKDCGYLQRVAVIQLLKTPYYTNYLSLLLTGVNSPAAVANLKKATSFLASSDDSEPGFVATLKRAEKADEILNLINAASEAELEYYDSRGLCPPKDSPFFSMFAETIDNELIMCPLSLDEEYASLKPVDVTANFSGLRVEILSSFGTGLTVAETKQLVSKSYSVNAFNFSTTTSDGWIGISSGGGKLLSARLDESVTATAKKLQAWECFRVYAWHNDFYFFSQAHGKYLKVNDERGNMVTASADNIYDVGTAFKINIIE